VARESESFSPEEVELLILENKITVDGRQEVFGVDREILSQIIDNVNSFNNILDKKTRMLKKAAHLLGGVSFHQPFKEGNKETALAWTILFLRRNGFNLPIQNTTEKKEIYDLLVRTSFKFEGDDTIIKDVEEYLRRTIVSFY
jgi:prophage maintenance system killer protein